MGDAANATPLKERLGLPNGITMRWSKHEGWHFGQIEETPEVFSQGRSHDELIDMILESQGADGG